MIVAIIAITVIVYSIFYFYEQLTKPTIGNQLFLYNTPSFWIVIAFLIYFSGTFFLYIYSQNKDLSTDNDFKTQYAIINSIFILLENILLGIAMLVKNKTETRTTPKLQPYKK